MSSWVVANTSANRILKTQEDAPGGLLQVVTGRSGLSKVEHHIKELLASKSIELAHVKEGAGNTKEHFYRAVEIPFFTDEEMWAKPFEVRQEIYGLILQSSVAEALAAFRAGKVSNDPHVCMAWRWFNLDTQGREDMAVENARS